MAYTRGELNQRITIERKQRTPDGGGGYVEAWSTVETRWALVRPMSGNERAASQQTQADANYLIVVRNPADVQHADRIMWNGDAYNVRFIKDRGSRALYLEIEAERGVLS